ncbi:MAG: oligoendopeptidase, partial [Solirubrobacteraceae bacterium]|nr:oligoendopeptidase [Solirubrobacteraceae bacterium]
MTVEDVSWDLSPLVHGEGDAGADRLLDEAADRAQAFATTYAGRVAELTAPEFAAAVSELQAISELASRSGHYAMLRFSIDTADPQIGALMQRMQEKSTAIETQLLFFELEWAALSDEQADALLEADGIDTARHFLRSARRYRPHLLSEPEEKILAEKTISGRSAWSRLFSEQVSALQVALPDEAEPVALDAALARLMSPDRDVRRTSAEAVTEALAPGLRTRAYIFNTLLHDKAVDDRLRHYDNWLAARNLANEASDESVQALLTAVRNRYEIPRRWYRLKAQLLGIDRLADYDRMAAVTQDDEPVDWDDAKELVLASYADFTPELGDPARAFFDDNRIDAPPRPAKRGGAFAAYTVPSEHPYLMLNYTAKRRDVLILAHEMGHGLHAELARPRGILEQGTPLTLAETASVFGETLVFGRLLDQAPTPESRLSLLAESIEGSIATVFRQTAMNRFEELVHTARREEGELALERINELWAQSQEEMLADSVQLTDGYRTWWSYVPHFISTPGYVYAYAYGQLLALSIYKRYIDEGPSFVP